MTDLTNLHSDILGSIMQNFANFTDVFPIINNPAANVGETSQVAESSSISFSQTLAQRIAELEYQDEYTIRNVINEEISAAVDRHSSDLIAQIALLDSPNAMNQLSSMLGLPDNGLNNGQAMDVLSMLQGHMSGVSGGTSALMGVADPMDTLQFYGQLLRLQQSRTA